MLFIFFVKIIFILHCHSKIFELRQIFDSTIYNGEFWNKKSQFEDATKVIIKINVFENTTQCPIQIS